MKSNDKKPTLLKYKNTMIPHILPIEARKLGITARNKIEWKNLAKVIHKYVENRYKQATPEELWADMSFDRYSKRKKKERKKTKVESQASHAKGLLFNRKEAYKKKVETLIPQPIITDDYNHTESIIKGLATKSHSTADWVFNRRSELLTRISKIEMIFAQSIAVAGYKVIMKMPFIIDSRIYFCNLYIPDLKFAIDITDLMISQTEKDCQKTEDLRYIGVIRLRISKEDATKRSTLDKILETLS